MYIALKQNNLMVDGQYIPNQAACPYFFATACCSQKPTNNFLLTYNSY